MSAFSSAPPPYDAAHGALPQAQADTMPSGSKSWTQLVRGTHDELYATWDSGMLGADAPPHVRGRSLALRTDGNQFHWSEWLQSITWHERAFGPAQSVMTFATRMFRSDSFEMQAAGSSRTLASWKERTGALTIDKQKLTVQADEGLQSAAVQLDGRACRWECVGELRTVDGHRWDKCTYGLYDTQSRELLASFRWITGAPRYAVDMTLYMWDANIDEHAVLSSFTVLLYKQWCRMTAEWNNLTTQGQLAVYESIVEDESTRHTYGFVSREKAAELRERAAEIVAQNRKNNVNSGIMSTLSANAGVVAVSI